MNCPCCDRRMNLSNIYKVDPYKNIDQTRATYKCVNSKCPCKGQIVSVTMNNNEVTDFEQEVDMGPLAHRRIIARKHYNGPFVHPKKPSRAGKFKWTHKGTRIV